MITTEETTERHRETRVYPVGRLVKAGMDLETLEDLIRELDLYGPIDASVDSAGSNLVVTQSQSGHRRTVDLLEQLHRTDEVKP